MRSVSACVFDAYGTLFDVSAAAERCRDVLGERLRPLAETWRLKQLQYTWLRSLMGDHLPFERVTADALDFAMEAVGLADAALRRRLLDLYMTLDPYPEVKDALAAIKAKGLRCAILSNGSPAMLEAAVKSAGIGALLDAVLSVEDVKVYKPNPRVYRLPVEALGLGESEMAFVSSNGWDAVAAARFGYRAIWVNRLDQPAERLSAAPAAIVRNLKELATLLP